MEPLSRRIILASQSPYRRELMERLGLGFETESPSYDEVGVDGETPREQAIRHGLGKARSVGVLHPKALVVGSDQVAECEAGL